MENFAIIDTETNWDNEVMSIGVAIANAKTFNLIDTRYYIITPEYKIGGMYSYELRSTKVKLTAECSRKHAIQDLLQCLSDNKVLAIFAYNASFDYRHLPELEQFVWYDIMRIAAYKQYNPKIKDEDCYRTGRLMRNYGVEAITNLLQGNDKYHETHNALQDAIDELYLMRLLQHKLEDYITLEKSKKPVPRKSKQNKVISQEEIEKILLAQIESYCQKILDMSQQNVKVITLQGGFKGIATYKCQKCGFEWTEKADAYLSRSTMHCPKCIK